MNFLTQQNTFTSLLAQYGTQSFELQARTGITSGNASSGSISTITVIAIVSFILVLFFMATLWPREKNDNVQFRQRQFGRVDGIFYRVQGALLDAEEAERYLTGKLATNALLQGLLLLKNHPLTLVSLSVGGCGFVSPTPVKKGELILLQLGSLPDFPEENLIVGCRVVWSKKNKGSHGSMESIGCKFVFPDGSAVPEDSLKRYITYLMDEPVS
ncbi:MAG: PilZ domain-containing protein [Betaproteobacteria bacterium]|nr:PilZ domain-containing protein [Betaproteobacteria bacterium]